MHKVVLATGNMGKVKELNSLLSKYNIDIVPQSDYDVGDVAETGTTFVENAIIKARHAAKITGLPTIADDSGLEVDALHGAPGVYSARYAGENASDDENTDKLLKALQPIAESDKTARFHCVLVYLRHANDPTPIICHGIWEGSICDERHGELGFGYDPVFWHAESNMTSAQMPRDLKNQLSHRGKALAQLIEKLMPTLAL